MKSDRCVLSSRGSSWVVGTLAFFVGLFLLAAGVHGAPGDKKWELQIGAGCSPGMAPDGNIIIVTGDGRLLAISQSGEIQRTSPLTPGFGAGICIAPDGVVYVGADKLYAFNADGSRRWEFDRNEGGFDTPVVAADGTVYAIGYTIGARETLYAVKPDGTLLWAVAAPRSSGELVLAKDGALVGGFSATNPDGANRWTSAAGRTLYSAPALDADGTIFIGSQNVAGAATLFALHGNGTAKWEFAANGTIIGAPVVGSDGTSYFRTDSGHVYAVDANGAQRWIYDTGAPALGGAPSSVALAANGTVYVGAIDGRLHALNAAGEFKWDFVTGARLVSAPLIGPDGTVYVGTDAGKFFAIEGEGSGLAQAPWPMHRRDRRFSASYAEAPTLPPVSGYVNATVTEFTDRVMISWQSAPGATGYEVWRSDTQDSAGAALLSSVYGALTFDDRTAVEGQIYYYFLKSVNAAGASAFSSPVQGGRRIAKEGELVWKYFINGALGTPAIGADGTVYSTGSDGRLYAIGANGLKKWEFDYAGSAATAPSIGSDGTIYFAASTRLNALTAPSEGWSFFAVSATGEKKWQHDSRAVGAPLIALGADGVIYAVTGEGVAVGHWMALNADGSTRWELAHEDDVTSNLAIGADGTLYAGTKDGQMLAVSKDGQFRWRLQTGGGWLGAIAIDGAGVLYASGTDLFAVNPDGIKRWVFPNTNFGVAPAAIGGDGKIYVGSNDGRLSIVNAGGTKTGDFSAGGMPGASVVGADGIVYFAALNNPLGSQFTLFAYAPDGTRKWEFTLGVNMGPPVMGSENLIFMAANDGALYAVRTGAALGDTAWPEYQADGARSGRVRKIPVAPAAPQNVVEDSSLSPAYVQIRWSSVLGATGYEIRRSTGTDPATAQVIAGNVAGQLTYNDTTGDAEMAYNYWLRALNAGGASDYSAMATATRRRPVPGDLLYEWRLEGLIHGSPAIADDGTIYVGVQNRTDTVAASSMYALNPNGTIKWARARTAWIFGAASIGADGTIYYGGYHRNFVALKPDGSLKWEMDVGGAVTSSPAIGEDGEIYFGTAAGKLYSVNADGTVRWTYTAAGSVLSAPAIGGDGAIYFRAGTLLYSVNRDGTERWRSKTLFGTGQTVVYSSPMVGPDGTIYIASDLGPVLAFNPDGVERWRDNAALGFTASPVMDAAGNIYIGSANFISLKPDGTTNWIFPTSPITATAALAANGLAYVPTGDGTLFAVNADGTKVWEAAVGTSIASSPAVAPDGTVYIGGQDGKLRSFYGTSPLAQSPWPMYQRDLKHTGRAEKRLVAAAEPTGVVASDNDFNNKVQVKWNGAANAWYYQVWRGETADVQNATLLAGRVTGANSFDDLSAEAGVTYQYWVRAGNDLGLSAFVGPDSGTRRFPVAGEKVGEIAAVFDSSSAPAQAEDGTIYVAGRGRLHALNLDLTQKWQYPSTAFQSGLYTFTPPAIGKDGTVYFGAPDGQVYAIGADGAKRWSYNTRGGLAGAPALGTDGTIYIYSGFDRRLVALLPNGTTNWTYTITGGAISGPTIGVDGTLYVAGADRNLYAIKSDGSLKWKSNLFATPNTPMVLGPDGTVYLGVTGRRLRAVSSEGAALWSSFVLGNEIVSPPVIGPDCTIYVGAGDSKIYAITPSGQKKWEFAAGGAIRGSPTVGQNGTVFFGSADRKVYALDAQGNKIWDLNPRQPLAGSPIDGFQMLTAEKILLAGTFDGALHAIYAGVELADAFWPVVGQNAQHTSRMPNFLSVVGDSPLSRVAGQPAQLQPQLSIARTFAKVELYEGTNLVSVTEAAPFSLVWTNIPLGNHEVTLRASDTNGCQYVSAPFVIQAVEDNGTITLKVTLDVSSPVLEFAAETGARYNVQYSADFKTWKTDPTALESATGTIRWTDDGPPKTESNPSEAPLRFYRVMRQRDANH